MALAAKAKGKGLDKDPAADKRLPRSETKNYTTETKEPEPVKRKPVQRMKSFKQDEDTAANRLHPARFLEDEIHEDEEEPHNSSCKKDSAAKKQKKSKQDKEPKAPDEATKPLKKRKPLKQDEEPETPDEPTKASKKTTLLNQPEEPETSRGAKKKKLSKQDDEEPKTPD